MLYVACAVGGLIVGGVLAWIIATYHAGTTTSSRLDDSERRASNAEGRAATLDQTIAQSRQELDKLRAQFQTEQAARVKAETESAQAEARIAEEKALLAEAKTALTDTFKALAGDVLGSSSCAFLDMAKQTLDKALAEARGDLGKRQEAINGIVKPLSDALRQYEEHVRVIEKNRQESYSGIEAYLKTLAATQQQLQKETGNLVTALRTPHIRGRWGEITLRRVVELAGMSPYCDFEEQVAGPDGGGQGEGRSRPDLIVHLPSDREVIVDSKVALDAYLSAVSAESEAKRNEFMVNHARQFRTHMLNLGSKSYWEQFRKAPEFVVMFVPGDSFLSAALEQEPRLLEQGMEARVIVATPTTLMALLRAVAYGWRQEQVAKNAQAISELGRQLHDRLKVFAEHLVDVRKGLQRTVESFNSAVGSLETRVFPAARRFKELGAVSDSEIPTVEPVDTLPRQLPESVSE